MNVHQHECAGTAHSLVDNVHAALNRDAWNVLSAEPGEVATFAADGKPELALALTPEQEAIDSFA